MTTQAYFENIQPVIGRELEKATQSITVAVAWFTDYSLYRILCNKASKGISVKVLILNDEINAIYGINPLNLKACGGEIHLIGSKDEMMHNKFCVIDQATVITGSYNCTKKAQSNDENITLTKGNPEFATDFLMEFARLKKKYLGETRGTDIDLSALVNRLEILKKTISLAVYRAKVIQDNSHTILRLKTTPVLSFSRVVNARKPMIASNCARAGIAGEIEPYSLKMEIKKTTPLLRWLSVLA